VKTKSVRVRSNVSQSTSKQQAKTTSPAAIAQRVAALNPRQRATLKKMLAKVNIDLGQITGSKQAKNSK